MNTIIRRKISLTLAVVPILLISLNKISIDHNFDKYGHWHRIINTPIERALSPILGEEYFIKRNYRETPAYGLDMFFWFALLYVIPIVSQVQVLTWARGLLRDLIVANITILSWFFIEFLLVYNMVSSIPKIIGWVLIVLSLRYSRLCFIK